MITINRPYIQEVAEHKVRLCDDILIDGTTNTVWFEVDKEYGDYLCTESADGFFVGILPYAMAFGHNIEVKESAISEKIYWQVINMFIPALSKYTNYYKTIQIETALTDTKYDSFAVGTGFSAGVDSFYTLLKNRNRKTKGFNLTHVTFFNVGACGSYGGNEARSRFDHRIKLFEKYVSEQGLSFVKVDSNISEVVMMSYSFTHTFRTAAAVLSLQKLFKHYYYSAGFSLKDFCLNPCESAYYDLMNVQCLSSESCTFYTTGATESRLEKIKFISEFPETYSLLNVCNDHDENCKTCEKCVRTMSELYSIGKLEKYEKVFDVPYYKKHLSKNMGFVLAKPMEGGFEKEFFLEIIKEFKKNGKSIPSKAYLYAIPYSVKFLIMKTARKSKVLKRWWHRRAYKKLGVRYNDI